MNITYAQMRYFTEVCRCGNLTRAAEALHVAQPSLSVAIKKMETQFDCALFYRQKGRLVLTQEGAYFLRKCKQLLKMVDDLNLNMLERSTGMKQLRIGVSTTGALLFGAAYMEFIRSNPDIQVEIVEISSAQMEAQLMQDELDVCVGMITEQLEAKCDTQVLGHFPLVFCVKKTHPLAARPSIRIEDLADQPLILANSAQFHSAELIRERFARAGIAPKVVLSTSQALTSTRYDALYGTGSFEVQEFVQDMPDITAIPLEPELTLQIGLIRHRGALLRSSTLQFLTHMQKYCRQPPATASK